MSIGLLVIGSGIFLCAAATIMIIFIAATAKGARKRILDKMEKKY